MKTAIDAEYGAMPGGGLVYHILTAQRRKMFDAFKAFRQGDCAGSVLHVGVSRDAGVDKPAYLVAWSDARQRARIHLHDIEPAGAADAVRLPFGDDEFDWVFCNEALEHAGRSDRQCAFVKELYRVARKGVFVTAGNRRHPLEFNTGLPFLHWLPDAWWRRLLRWTGRARLASGAAFNPVDSAQLYRCAGLLSGAPEHDVGHKRVWGAKAHFFLMIRKAA